MSIINRPFITTFRKTVANAGTAEQLHTNLNIPDQFHIIIKALDDNTGNVLLGGSQSDAESTDAFVLDAGQSIGYKITNANAVWIDVTVNGEGVVCTVEQF